jgi:hypothetical protein
MFVEGWEFEVWGKWEVTPHWNRVSSANTY